MIQKHQLPNTISLLRIILSFFSIYLFIEKSLGALVVLFFFLGFSDWVDGYLARRWNCQSLLGSILDPIGDKLALFIYLFSLHHYFALGNFYLMILLSARDIGIVVTFIFLYKRGYMQSPNVSFISKLNSFVLGLYVWACLICAYTDRFVMATYLWRDSFLYLSFLTVIWSSIEYVLIAKKVFLSKK